MDIASACAHPFPTHNTDTNARLLRCHIINATKPWMRLCSGGDKSMGSVAAWDNVWMDGHAPRGGARGRGKRNRSSSSHTGGGGRGRGAAQEGGRGRGGLKCYR